jgi:quercetin dioxygenase-like cupin family protein
VRQILLTHERRVDVKHIARWRERRLPVIAVAVLIGCIIGMGADRLAFAQQPGIKRTILLRTADPGNAAYEAVLGVAELPPGGSAGKHRHHGIEVGYVLEGSLAIEHEGQPVESFTAGQAFKDIGGVHNARNPGKVPTRILAVYIVEKGKPLAEPVP